MKLHTILCPNDIQVKSWRFWIGYCRSICPFRTAPFYFWLSLLMCSWKIFCKKCLVVFVFYYTPIFRRDVLRYGDVRPGLRPSDSPSGLRPSVRVSVRPFSALFSYMLWHIELKFCTWLCFNVLQIKFECCTLRQFLKELCLFVNLEYR